MSEEMRLETLPMEDLFADPEFNCRGYITPLDVTDLAKSMEQDGLQQPIAVQPWTSAPGKKWRVVMGHRRHRAAQILSWASIPCVIREGLTDDEARVLNLTENTHRKELNILQEANAIRPFAKRGVTQEDIAKLVKQSRGWVQVRLALLELPADVQLEAAAGRLTNQQIRDLNGISSRDEIYAMVRLIKERKERGETTPRVTGKKKPKSIFTKKERNRAEIFEIQEHIQDAIGNNFGTRCLAWAAGQITDGELYKDIRELAEELGVPYEIPKDIVRPLLYGITLDTE